MGRLLLALGSLGLLAFSALLTLSDTRFRTVTLALLAMFAVLIVTAHFRGKQQVPDDASE